MGPKVECFSCFYTIQSIHPMIKILEGVGLQHVPSQIKKM